MKHFVHSLLLITLSGLPAIAAKPNFVVIFSDDQGYQDIGCFGSPDIRTPRLDAMAAAGMKFTSFYAQPICGPSRAAIMTGCYPMRVAERGNVKQVHPILHSKEVTVAEVLKTQGYATACFGKWDLAKHAQSGFFPDLFPAHQGFDYFFGTPTSNDRIANLYRNEKLIEPKADMSTLTQRYTDEAIRFMQRNKDQPFFVYLPHTMPHTALDASPQFKGKSKRGIYGDVIEELDHNVGRIIDAVDEMGLDERTYIIYTSDNGPWLIKNKSYADGSLPGDHGGSAGPLRSGKVSTFEGGVRVPTIVWGPNRVPAGKTCDKLASTLDILPTLAALAGAKVPDDRVIDGEDIRHLIHGDFAAAQPDKAFFYYLRVHLQAVRQGQWKLHLPRKKAPPGAAPFSNNNHIAPADRIGFDAPFLVNLNDDIGETTNVAAAHPDVVKRLMKLAEDKREDLGDFDRVGKNMRFFDLDGERPKTPPVPKPATPRRPRPLQVNRELQGFIEKESKHIAQLTQAIDALDLQLETANKEIKALAATVASGDESIVIGNRSYTIDQVRTDLAARTTRFKSREMTIRQLKQVQAVRISQLTHFRTPKKAATKAQQNQTDNALRLWQDKLKLLDSIENQLKAGQRVDPVALKELTMPRKR